MNTKAVLGSSALVLGISGIAGTFMPHELLRMAGVAPQGILPLLVQLFAALLFAFSMVNWTARGSLIGGIYNRPVATGNVTHFAIGALSLLKVVLAGERRIAVIALTLVYIAFALAFTAILLRSPAKQQSVASS